MIDTPLISVILPCYNASQYLEEALDSVIYQTYTNLEILCIDDGSTDNTLSILNTFAEKDHRIKVIQNEQNIKLIATLNKGIQLAQGALIARMDADDICSTDRILLLYETLIAKNVDIVSCNFDYIDTKSAFVKSNKQKAISQDEIELGSFLFTPIGHAMLLGRTSVFKEHSYHSSPDVVHTEDYELWTRMLRNNVSFFNLDKPLYSIRVNPESVSNKFETLQKQNFAICAKKHFELLFNQSVSQHVYDVVVNRFESIDKNTLSEAFHIIKNINSALNKGNKNALRLICEYQRLDILIQAYRKGNLGLKLRTAFQLMALITRNLFSSNFRTYIKTKF